MYDFLHLSIAQYKLFSYAVKQNSFHIIVFIQTLAIDFEANSIVQSNPSKLFASNLLSHLFHRVQPPADARWQRPGISQSDHVTSPAAKVEFDQQYRLDEHTKGGD